MRAALVTLLCAAALSIGAPSRALARDPFHGDVPPPAPDDQPTPDPSAYKAPPPGIYYVTDTYVADVVTVDGPLTTYSTSTVHESTGSYARVLGTVATGVESAFDGAAFNGRSSLTDGRGVAGTYYENYILTDGDFVPVSIVFFQDDAELARLAQESQRANAPRGPGGSSGASTPPAPTEIPAGPATEPCCDSADRAEVPDRAEAPDRAQVSDRPATIVRVPLSPGISLEPASAPLTRIEVLRGRPIALWARAFARGREIPVDSWAIVAGETGSASRLAGGGGVPFRTSWDHLPPPGSSYALRFRIVADTPETGRVAVEAEVWVVVRSPALDR